jgi:hypothetical protein
LRHRLAESACQALKALNWERQRSEYLRAIDSLFEQHNFATDVSANRRNAEAGES